MNKNAFLKALKKELHTLRTSEIQKNIGYYEELIADMVENGLSEESAVEKIGSPKKAAREILENTDPENFREKDIPGTFLVCASIAAILLSIVSGVRQHIARNAAVYIIGGADGPTSIFLAGRIGAPRMWMVAAVIIGITVIYKLLRIRKKK